MAGKYLRAAAVRPSLFFRLEPGMCASVLVMNNVVKAAAWGGRDTVAHARGLLGCWLCVRQADASVARFRITETEAYHGPEDRACHASKGKTARTEVMFGPAGTWYVYLCYGMHEMANLVTGPKDWPAAVLIRGVEGISGPGRVTRRLGIGRGLNGTRAEPVCVSAKDGENGGSEAGAGARPAAWIEKADEPVPEAEVVAGPRVGVDYAGPEWAAKPWRFRWITRWSGSGKV
jgi:DNA-3-methyladenine glycosylase